MSITKEESKFKSIYFTVNYKFSKRVMVKKLKISVLLLLAGTIIFTSCTNENKNIKIALMLPTLGIARFQKDSALFLQEASRVGVEAYVTNAKNDENLQFNQAAELIEKGINTLIIAAVNSNTAALMVRMAQDKGIKTISYDGILNNCAVDYCISFDNKKLGELMAQYALSKAPEGDYVILGGDKTNLNAIEIRDGQVGILKSSIAQNKIKIVYDNYIEVWNRDEAYMTMKNYMRLTSGAIPAAMLCANDEIALGAIRAIKEYAKGKEVQLPVITGQDASLDGCLSIMQGEQSMTVYKPIKKLTAVAVDVACKVAKGQKVDGVNATTNTGTSDVPTIILDLISVDKLNMESTVIADGFQNKSDVIK